MTSVPGLCLAVLCCSLSIAQNTSPCGEEIEWTPGDLSVYGFTPEEFYEQPDLDGPPTIEYSGSFGEKVTWIRMVQWNKHDEFVPITDHAGVKDVIRSQVDDPDELLTQENIDQLADRFLERLSLLTNDSPDLFIDHIRNDQTRLIDVNYKLLSYHTILYNMYLGEIPSEGTPVICTIDRLWERARELGMIPAEVGATDRGAWVFVHNASPDDANYRTPLWGTKLTGFEPKSYWRINFGGNSTRVSHPAHTLELHLKQQKSAPAVTIFILVRLRNGTVARLTEKWFLNESDEWIFEERAIAALGHVLTYE